MSKKKKPVKLTPKQEKFIELEKRRMRLGKGSRIDSLREAGYSTKSKYLKQIAYNIAHGPKIQNELKSFASTLLNVVSPEQVAKTMKEDILDNKDARVRIQARQQWLKATGNEGPTTLKIKTAWTRLSGYFEDENQEDNQPGESTKEHRVYTIPSPGEDS